jgi:hypothetical protein
MRLEQNHQKTRDHRRDSLFLLECLIFHTGLVVPNTDDDLDPLLWGQEPGIGRGVGEEEPEKYRGDESQDTGDGDQPLPGFEAWGSDVRAAEGEQAQEDDGNAVHEDWERASEEVVRERPKEWQTYTSIQSSASAQRVCRTWR